MSVSVWWKNARGEAWVLLQALLFLLILFGPTHWPGAPAWPAPLATISAPLGIGLGVAGLMVAILSARHLGRNLTPLPHPRDDAHLVVGGLYAHVRHPMYFSVLLMAGGWALWRQGGLTLVYVLALGIFFDLKSRREERCLLERFPAYADYRRRVKKLIPWLY